MVNQDRRTQTVELLSPPPPAPTPLDCLEGYHRFLRSKSFRLVIEVIETEEALSP